MKIFEGRKIVIATKHQKEKVISPLLKSELSLDSFSSFNFDTDELGTFSGEIERKLSPIETVKQKCLMAMEMHHCDLGIANEGSFGPHPQYYFLPSDEEYIVFIDKKNNIEIVDKIISTQTNFNHKQIFNEDDLIDFAKSTLFPTHALIIKSNQSIYKGINNWDDLFEIYKKVKNQSTNIFAETDMRAMYNPSRMAVIEQLTLQLIEKIKKTCPKCKMPGFSISNVNLGLPCENCSLPTKGILSYTYKCKKCNYEEILNYPNQKNTQEAQYCDYCNP